MEGEENVQGEETLKGKQCKGKGAGRKINPHERESNIMKRFTPGCNSTTHLKRHCHIKGGARGQPSNAPATTPSTIAYVDDYESLCMITHEEAWYDDNINVVTPLGPSVS